MTFQELKKFIIKEMRMSHIYQPVMLIEILKKGGFASTEQIAKAILNHDPTQEDYYKEQVDYYKKTVNRMVGKVLTSNRGITARTGDTYSLIDSEKLNKTQTKELISLCQEKIKEYNSKRNGLHWEHRRQSRKPTDDLSNFQTLCHVCNAKKSNKDDTSFRYIDAKFNAREKGCLFCNKQKKLVSENDLAYSIRDNFAVTQYHSLIIPKRHCKDYFELVQAEINALNQLMFSEKNKLSTLDKTITGFNIGVNCGEDAGQTIFHCHLHLIPRRKGDDQSPRGGVRKVVDGKGYY